MGGMYRYLVCRRTNPPTQVCMYITRNTARDVANPKMAYCDACSYVIAAEMLRIQKWPIVMYVGNCCGEAANPKIAYRDVCNYRREAAKLHK